MFCFERLIFVKVGVDIFQNKMAPGPIFEKCQNMILASLSEYCDVSIKSMCKQTRAAFFQWRAEFLLHFIVEYVLEMFTKLFTEALSHLKPKVYPICELI